MSVARLEVVPEAWGNGGLPLYRGADYSMGGLGGR